MAIILSETLGKPLDFWALYLPVMFYVQEKTLLQVPYLLQCEHCNYEVFIRYRAVIQGGQNWQNSSEITSYPMIAHCSPFFLSPSHPQPHTDDLITPRLYHTGALLLPPLLSYAPFVKTSLFITHRPKQRSLPLGSTHCLCKWYGCWLLIALAQRVIEVLLHNLWSAQKKTTSLTNAVGWASVNSGRQGGELCDTARFPLVSATQGNMEVI